MKRFKIFVICLISTLLLLLLSNLGFTQILSNENLSTGGLGMFLGDLDLLQDPLLMTQDTERLMMEKYLLDVKIKDFSDTITGWPATFDTNAYNIALGVPIEIPGFATLLIGAVYHYRDFSNSDFTSNETETWSDVDTNGTLETLSRTSTYEGSSDNNELHYLNFLVGTSIAGANFSAGIRWQKTHMDQVGTFDPNNPGIGFNTENTIETINYDLGINPFSITETLYRDHGGPKAPLGDRNGGMESLIVLAGGGYNIMDLVYVGLSFGIDTMNKTYDNNKGYFFRSNINTTSPLIDPSLLEDNIGEDDQYFKGIRFNATLYLFTPEPLEILNLKMIPNLFFYIEPYNMADAEWSHQSFNGILTTRTIVGSLIETTTTETLRSMKRQDHSIENFNTSVFPYFIFEVYENTSVALGFNYFYQKTTETYITSASEMIIETFDDGNGVLDMNDYTQITQTENGISSFNHDYSDRRVEIETITTIMQLPVALNWQVSDTFALFLSGVWERTETKRVEIDKYIAYPISNVETTYGTLANPISVVPGPVNTPGVGPTSEKDSTYDIDDNVNVGLGASFRFLENMSLDLALSYSAMLSTANISVETKIYIGGSSEETSSSPAVEEE